LNGTDDCAVFCRTLPDSQTAQSSDVPFKNTATLKNTIIFGATGPGGLPAPMASDKIIRVEVL
jgi:hypothetical protein